MSEELEHRYRRLLRLFPPSYRREREQELLWVLLQAARPGQRRPAVGETLALLGQAARTWARTSLPPDRAANQVAAGALAVALPLILLYPVAQTGLDLFTLPWVFIWTNHHDLIAWGVWALAIAATYIGPAGMARWLAGIGTIAYVVALAMALNKGDTGTLATGFCWLTVQLTAWCLLRSPTRVTLGRRLIRRYWWLVLSALALAIISEGWPGFYVPTIAGIYWPLTLASVGILVAAVAGLRTPAGRVVVTVGGALLAGFVAGHGWWIGIGDLIVFYPTSNHPGASELVWLVLLPTLTWIALRLAGAFVARRSAAGR